MGDEQEGDAGLALEGFEFEAHLLAQFGIEGGEGLIEQEHIGLEHEGAGEGDALAFAAGELGGAALFLAGEADEGDGFADAAFDFRDAVALEAEFDIGAGGEVGEEGVVLEDGADVAFVGRVVVDGLAIEQHIAGGGLFETGDEAEGGGLAAAGGSEEGEEGAARDGERDAPHCLLAGKVLDQIAEFEDRRHGLLEMVAQERGG